MDRRRFLTVAVATTPLVAGCTGDGGTGGTPADGAHVTISMKNTTFQTLKAEVATGATVEWVNDDGYPHTVTAAQFHDVAKTWSFDEKVAGGERVTYTFDAEGVYEYYCTIHGKSTMCGAVLVGGASLGASLPCSGDGYGGGDGY